MAPGPLCVRHEPCDVVLDWVVHIGLPVLYFCALCSTPVYLLFLRCLHRVLHVPKHPLNSPFFRIMFSLGMSDLVMAVAAAVYAANGFTYELVETVNATTFRSGFMRHVFLWLMRQGTRRDDEWGRRNGREVYLNPPFQIGVMCLNGLSRTTSMLHLFLMAANRYTAFKRPYTHEKIWSPERLHRLLGLCWMVGCVNGVAYLLKPIDLQMGIFPGQNDSDTFETAVYYQIAQPEDGLTAWMLGNGMLLLPLPFVIVLYVYLMHSIGKQIARAVSDGNVATARLLRRARLQTLIGLVITSVVLCAVSFLFVLDLVLWIVAQKWLNFKLANFLHPVISFVFVYNNPYLTLALSKGVRQEFTKSFVSAPAVHNSSHHGTN